ncbi:MAG: hypothetical protein UV65_C0014G0007 [Parcubacteria group bacterium GW2011_GWF2_43_11]|nr:MAG: hypothetical protein UV65_C0014G0007 [Parcubacteria group bacterium GW2011_GWF2_43_11]
MIYPYKGHYQYNETVIGNWDSSAIGVYYCGYANSDNKLTILYVGKGVGENGIRGRLLDHIRDENWPDVTHFGYQLCDYASEAEKWEADEIKTYKPKYNEQGK